MLFGEQGGRRENAHLLAAHGRDERRTQGDLGFTKADIAAHQSVHRFGIEQIMGHGGNRARLIGRGFKAKIIGKHFVIREIQREGVTFAHCAPRVKIEQLCCGIADLLGGFFARARPAVGAKVVQRRVLGVCTCVA